MKAAAFSRSRKQPHSFFPQPYPAVVMSGVGRYCGDWALLRYVFMGLETCVENLEVMQVAQP